ncbi:MAG TPA: peptidoglycan DD-metalloendopeptidase family protein [Acidimicrobiales bacterium]|nr:peptidoglycan DD-metalloendopeptidase family protein [Acidimicrobiales bacterium]
MRRALGIALAALLTLAVASPASAAGKAGDLAAKQKDAQRRANAAAARLSQAEAALARAEAAEAEINARASSARDRLASLEVQVRRMAIGSYIDGGRAAANFVIDAELKDLARGQALLRYATLGTSEAIDAYRSARQDFEASSSAMRTTIAERRAASAALRKERAKIAAELDRLADAQRELDRRQRAAALKAKTEAAKRNRSPALASRSAGSLTALGSGSWICPVQGPRAFSNDWGAPRSGGRRHQGNDIMSPTGTPVVANVGGTVRQHQSSLGGLSYYLQGDDGVTYYGAHLSAYAASGRVSAGTVIGRVGTSGNARGGVPHLHFEVHPGGGGAINPYPTLTKYC